MTVPDGRTHAQITLVAVPIISLAVGYSLEFEAAFFVGMGILYGLLLTPDLDLGRGALNRHYARRLGIGLLWAIWWYGYGKLFRHRGLSHTPILGTLTRLVWGFPFTLAPLVYFEVVTLYDYLWWAGGLAVSDILHWAADKIVTRARRGVIDDDCC